MARPEDDKKKYKQVAIMNTGEWFPKLIFLSCETVGNVCDIMDYIHVYSISMVI